jgi:hypothetical protein
MSAIALCFSEPAHGRIGFDDIVEKLDHGSATGPDPSPIAHERTAAEKGGLDGQGIEAGHVAAAVDFLQEQVWGCVVGHDDDSRGGGERRPID